MVRMLNRLIEPTAGEVLIDGEDIVSMTDDELVKLRRAKLSMVFQSFALMPHLTVLQNAAFGLEMDGVDKATREKRALEALAQVGLDAWANSYPSELSGGMQQRALIAIGRACEPALLLADEPNIKEVIAFPKTQRATDLMTEAPGQVDRRQLDELGVRVLRLDET